MADDGGGGASSSSSSSSKSSYSSIYDVFLSFRGEIRHSFTDHLYHALTKNGINTFRDTEKLRVGEEIRPTLLDAIQRSRMSIPVLSQNYASSSWCLDELVKIMECSGNGRNRPVLPVFYHVVPSDLRYQKNQVETAMATHEDRYGKNSKRVKAWRSALFAVCELSGIDCRDRSENDIIQKIVGEVLRELPREPLQIKQQVVLNSRFEAVKSLLDIESHETICILCIYGDGETDKTGFIGAVFNKISGEFEEAFLLANVSEKSTNGLEDLQKTLLSMMNREPKTEIGSTFRGCSEIKRRLGHRRVLLILDGVDSVEQLESLAGGADWFGPGSRIIITSRDEHVANKHMLDGVEIKKYCIDECDFEGTEAGKSKEGDIVGFEDSLREVIDQLKKEDAFRNVVAITGMGGLGKTALAEKIYESNEVKKLFPCRAWSCVSKDFNERRVLLSLLSCLKSLTSKDENLSEEMLKKEVRKYLEKNKYLVVVDDIWKPQVWDKIKHVFPNNKNGSMILITSRNDKVAHYTRSRSPHHQLPPLNAANSWKLFCKKVFGEEECPPDLEPIGKSIVERCGGLPLAIITLAGLVAQNEISCAEWSQIEGFVPWYLAEDRTKVMDVLKVSYDNLPDDLKPCFLYFGIYPEDHKILARELIQLWIAEGFIQPGKTATSKAPKLEDIGEKYLKELVDRNLVQVTKRRSDSGLKTCRIHDLLHELCIIESKVDNFLEVCTESTNYSLSNSCRLSLLCDEQYYMSLIKCSQASTRSLFFFGGKSYPPDILKDFPLVHVLHVARRVPFENGPSDFTKMIHLKYLKIEAGNCVRGIPDCIWSLPNLETLDLRGWLIVGDAIDIWKMERLRHFYTRMYATLGVDKEGANNKRIMWNLQTLSIVDLAPQTMSFINSGSFPNLKKLGLSYNLRFNRLKRENSWNLQHLRNLRTLKIEFCFDDVSLDEIEFPSNISKITLRNFVDLDSGCMNVLAKIPSLLILKLAFGDNINTLNCGAAAGDFQQLQVFHIEKLSELRRLTQEKGAMPLLQRMVIRHCDMLEEVPERLLSLSNS